MPEKADKSRLEQFLDAGKEVTMPPLSASYLVAYLFEAGPTYPGPMGNVGLPYSEIAFWQQQTGYELSSWEVSVLHKASASYAAQASQSTDPACQSPYIVVERSPKSVAKHIKSVLRG